MTELLLRELFVMARRTSFALAACTFVLLSIGFALSWPNGVPLYAGASLFPQLTIVLQLAVTIIAPWVVCRCGTRERGNDLVHLSMFSAVRPSRIVLARFLASTAALLVMVLGTLPAMVYAQQASVEMTSTVVAALINVLGTIAAVAAWTLAVQQSVHSYVRAWLVATGPGIALWVLAQLDRTGFTVAAVTLLGSIGCLALGAARADVTSRYLVEEKP